MPDQMLIAQGVGAAAFCAAILVLLVGWPLRPPRSRLIAAGSVFGAAVGFCVGCSWLGILPSWPGSRAEFERLLLEDRNRLLFIVLPAVCVCEIIGAWLGKPAWVLRLGIAAAAAPVLLHKTRFVADLDGPGSRAWTPEQAWQIFAGLALALLAVWAALALLMKRSPGQSTPIATALACGAAAVTVMLSGYASGGELGLPLTSALGGAALATLVVAGPPDLKGLMGVGLVGLYSLLVIGYFFGSLKLEFAVALFSAPLLCWLPELPGIRKLSSTLRGGLRIPLTAVPLVVVVALAFQNFQKASVQTAPGSPEPTLEDYMNFGK